MFFHLPALQHTDSLWPENDFSSAYGLWCVQKRSILFSAVNTDNPFFPFSRFRQSQFRCRGKKIIGDIDIRLFFVLGISPSIKHSQA